MFYPISYLVVLIRKRRIEIYIIFEDVAFRIMTSPAKEEGIGGDCGIVRRIHQDRDRRRLILRA